MSALDFIRTSKVDNVKLVHHCSNGKTLHGTLHLTTTHIIFINPKGANETWILYSHIAEAEKLPLSARGSSIRLKTKTFLSITLIITRERDCNDVFHTIEQFSNPVNYEDLYAFHYNPKEEELPQSAGWAVYDVAAEFNRMEVPEALWTPTKLNEEYKLCSTYPHNFYIPACTTEEVAIGCAQFRSKSRLPVLSYYNKSTKAAITRCAQPLAGFNTRCNEDEQMIQDMIKSNPNSTRIYIVDTRPKINAMANRAAGKGYENVDNYDNVDFQFIGIENIHAMRSSLRKMIDIFEMKDLTVSAYLKGIEESGWLKHIKSVMDTSAFIAKAVNNEKRTVLVHCSDGWDRTAQTCSLAGVLLDPYYRTIHGFQILVEKEWLSFGHKFTDRCGLLSGDPKETSPIFTQFLESIWQLMNQYPTAFQFNEQLLLEIHDHLYSCQFGTFIGNNEKERVSLKLSERTYSIWGYVWQNLMNFVNPFYNEASYDILVPMTSPKHFRIWRNLYNKHSYDVLPREIINNFVNSLNDHNTSLKDHIRYLEKRIEKLRHLNLSDSSSSSNEDMVIVEHHKINMSDGEEKSYSEINDLKSSDGSCDEGNILHDNNAIDSPAEDFEKLEVTKNNQIIDSPVIEDFEKLEPVSDVAKNNHIVDSQADDFENLESVSEVTKNIPEFALDWDSLLTFSKCSCGKLIDPLKKMCHCWNCGRRSCSFCVYRHLKIPAHSSEVKNPVCTTCYKQLNGYD